MNFNFFSVIFIAINLLAVSDATNGLMGMMKYLLSFTVEQRQESCQRFTYETSCGVSLASRDKIVGGDEVQQGEFPWLISLQIEFNSKYYHSCGGSIINSSWIVTAGHCVHDHDAKKLRVGAGLYSLTKENGNEQYRKVGKIVEKGFNPQNFKNDIALLKLEKPLTLNEYVRPICLPDHEVQFEALVEIAGWGLLKEDGMLPQKPEKVCMQVEDLDECHDYYKSIGLKSLNNNCQICTRSVTGKDSCQGDSGGPLMCTTKKNGIYYLCGLVSWGIGCARPNNPGIYTNVSCFTDWITTNVQGYCEEQ